ncbi:response regulator [Legionella feeleii]|uniref:response regulator n=1 Tax=Legionella feeleii TaxID=453 RepID=UPI001FD59DB9|nr:response regulator [Legionella feeleii]
MALADTAEEALERLAEQAYQCIIPDLGLPDRPGIELLPIIRNSPQNIERHSYCGYLSPYE